MSDNPEFNAEQFRRTLLSNLVTDTIFIARWYSEFGEMCDAAFTATHKKTVEGRRQRETASLSMALATGIFGLCRRADHFLLMYYMERFADPDDDSSDGSGGDDDIPDGTEGPPKMPVEMANPYSRDPRDEFDVRPDLDAGGLACLAEALKRLPLSNRRVGIKQPR